MRRGLMGWNEDELPIAALEQRVGRLQSAMQQHGLDALLIYTNLVRPSAVSWLTGLTPYWSEGLLLVGRTGAPIFATALSKRVANWMRSVSPQGEIVNNPRPGTLLGQRIAADGSLRRVGILELDELPSGAYDDLAAAAPNIEFSDATAMFRAARRGVDAAERLLLACADTIAVAALDQIDAGSAEDAGSVAGLVEKHARLSGAEEAYIAVAPNLAADRRLVRASPMLSLGERFAVRASIAYKGHWVRRLRTFAKETTDRPAVARADELFAALVSSLAADRPLADQMAGMTGWMAESCIGTYPLQVIASSRSGGVHSVKSGDFLVLTIEREIAGRPWLGAAPLTVGQSLGVVVPRLDRGTQ
jgi:creatinase/prolidase-like protein